MSNLPQDLVAFITGTTAVTSLIGSSKPRVHYSQVPQSSATSWIWLSITSDTQEYTLDKVAGIRQAFIDVEAVCDSLSAAQALGDQITVRLDGYRGTAGNSTIQGAWLSDKDDTYAPKSLSNQDDGRHVVAFDLRLWYST